MTGGWLKPEKGPGHAWRPAALIAVSLVASSAAAYLSMRCFRTLPVKVPRATIYVLGGTVFYLLMTWLPDVFSLVLGRMPWGSRTKRRCAPGE